MDLQPFESVPVPRDGEGGTPPLGRAHPAEAVVRTFVGRQATAHEGAAVLPEFRHAAHTEHVVRAPAHARAGVRAPVHHVSGEADTAQAGVGRFRLSGVQSRSDERPVSARADGECFLKEVFSRHDAFYLFCISCAKYIGFCITI